MSGSSSIELKSLQPTIVLFKFVSINTICFLNDIFEKRNNCLGEFTLIGRMKLSMSKSRTLLSVWVFVLCLSVCQSVCLSVWCPSGCVVQPFQLQKGGQRKDINAKFQTVIIIVMFKSILLNITSVIVYFQLYIQRFRNQLYMYLFRN